jgi:hypothetical protein
MDLDPIEQYLRGEEPPDGVVLLIRGGPVTVEKLVEHARRQEREFSWRGAADVLGQCRCDRGRLDRGV